LVKWKEGGERRAGERTNKREKGGDPEDSQVEEKKRSEV